MDTYCILIQVWTEFLTGLLCKRSVVQMYKTAASLRNCNLQLFTPQAQSQSHHKS
jgi:hypothetical protein